MGAITMKKDKLFSGAIFLCFMSIVAAIYTFVVIPNIKEQERKRYDTALENIEESYVPVMVYEGTSPLPAGTILDEKTQDLFIQKRMPAFCLSQYALDTFSSAEGHALVYGIVPGQQLTADILEEPALFDGESRRIKEFKVSNLVGEKVFPGSLVDILVQYENGQYDIVVPAIRIYDILTEEAGTKYIIDEQGMYTILVGVTEEAYGDLYAAQRKGTLEVRLYPDTGTSFSMKTFIR